MTLMSNTIVKFRPFKTSLDCIFLKMFSRLFREDPTPPDTSDDRSVDVTNMDNSVSRWAQAIQYYHKSCSTIRSNRTDEKCRCTAVIDVSSSMEGKFLICVKLGLCSLIANLNDDDEMNITAFSGDCKPVTGGFLLASELRQSMPRMLHSLVANGCTSFYDAIVTGLADLRHHCSVSISESAIKNILVALTDGEDNNSRLTTGHVLRHLCSPGVDHFMFLLVAVDMTSRQESKFRNWMDLGHCKQVSVNVRTGCSLVGVFKELLLCRILQTAGSSPRFLQDGGEGLPFDSIRDVADASALDTLRQQLMRHLPTTSSMAEQNYDFEESSLHTLHLTRNLSAGVSRVESESDGEGDFDDDSEYLSSSHISTCDEDLSGSDDDALSLTETWLDIGDTQGEGSQMNINSECTSSREYPPEFYCPISHEIMKDPVMCADGHTYERSHIAKWLSRHNTSPITNEILRHNDLVTNFALKGIVESLTTTKA